MSAQLICTRDGKRTHIGVYTTDHGWLPICGQPTSLQAQWGRYRLMKRIGRQDRRTCLKCLPVASQVYELGVIAYRSVTAAASTEVTE